MTSPTDRTSDRRANALRLRAVADALLGGRPTTDAARELHRLGGALAGVPGDTLAAADAAWTRGTALASGLALDPAGAAACTLDAPRTRAFGLGLRRALERALARFEERPLRVLYAGTGPLAPLALLQLPRFGPEEVRFTLLDVHAAAVDRVAALFDALGATASIEALARADATIWQPSGDRRFHVFVCEVMQQALTVEPQVAIVRHLARFLDPRGALVPERIDLELCLLDPADEHARVAAVGREATFDRAPLGRVLRVDRSAPAELAPDREGRLRLGTVRLPSRVARGAALHVLTRVTTYPGLELGERESGLTHPWRVPDAPAPAPDASLEVDYRLGPAPRLVAAPPA